MPREIEKIHQLYEKDEVQEAREDGYNWGLDTFRGVFYSLEDALEYAQAIGLPCTFVQTDLGVEVYIDYEEEGG